MLKLIPKVNMQDKHIYMDGKQKMGVSGKKGYKGNSSTRKIKIDMMRQRITDCGFIKILIYPTQ